MAIQIDAITKKYGEQVVLNSVSFEVNRGEILGFLGPNGAGKSTLMKIITGFIPAHEGRVTVNGIDVAANPMETKRQIGYLPEHNPLYLDMYVKEYLRFSGRSYGLGSRLSKRVDEVVEQTGIAPERHKKLGQLSKGFRQRVGLAQAILHDPDVLILDEPTTGLDPNQLVDIRQLIVEIGREKTVLLSTHIMQEVEAMCKRVAIINKGQLVADETTDLIRGQQKGGQQILVEFLEEVDADVLKNLDYISEITPLSPKLFLLQNVNSIDIRPLIFKFAASNGFTIVGMQLKEQRLEEIFRQLTSSTQ